MAAASASSRKTSKFELFKQLSNYDENSGLSDIVPTSKFVGDYASLTLGNGGDWCRRDSVEKKYKFTTQKMNGTMSYLWDAADDEKTIILGEFEKYRETHGMPITKGNRIELMMICGKNSADTSRPISARVRSHYRRKPCVVCGNKSHLVVDHKNDLYNDPRVRNLRTQTVDDFQSLCNGCNLKKRQIARDTCRTGQRYGATNIPMMAIWGVDFTEGDETIDLTDPRGMVGTFWYDPVAFMEAARARFHSRE